ncbi:hypothetical protein [Leisingera sp.]|uniref:hypothetical protein n=1 Tax=Leisingera sp. TaxID=1879318 RepID=UPI003A9384D8
MKPGEGHDRQAPAGTTSRATAMYDRQAGSAEADLDRPDGAKSARRSRDFRHEVPSETGSPAERLTYRRRRLMDIARLLPVLGALLLALPLLWAEASTHPAARDGVSMSTAIIYVFAVWAGLIVACFAFSLAVQRWAEHWIGRDTAQAVSPGQQEGR